MQAVRNQNRIHYVQIPEYRLIQELNITPRIERVEDVELVIKQFDGALDRSRSLGERVSDFFTGQTKLSRGIGFIFDIATFFVPYGRKIHTGREALRLILKRKQRDMAFLNDKAWYQSKTIWSAIIVLVTALCQYIGIEAQIAYEFIYALAGALGLVGLRQAVSPKVKE